MVSTKTALISSTITSGLVTGSYVVADFIVTGSGSFDLAGAVPVAGTVFAVTFALSFGGMKGLLPF
jgi:hypothetical protein